jgi:hypothetical protein
MVAAGETDRLVNLAKMSALDGLGVEGVSGGSERG